MKKCRKWNHDFSYKGKKRPSEINCNKCGINIVYWAEDRKEEYEKKLYRYGLNKGK
jgi:hypothetical protein